MRKTHERRKEGGNLEEGEQSLAEALRVGMTYTLSTIAARSCFKSRFFLTTTTPSIFLRLTLLLVALLSPQQTEVKRGNLEKKSAFCFSPFTNWGPERTRSYVASQDSYHEQAYHVLQPIRVTDNSYLLDQSETTLSLRLLPMLIICVGLEWNFSTVRTADFLSERMENKL